MPFKVQIAANAQLTGWWQGQQLGLVSLIREATEFRGAQFDGTCLGAGVFFPELPVSV